MPRPAPPALNLSGAASLVKFASFTNDAPEPGTLLYTAFRRNIPAGVKELTVRTTATSFYGIQQTGGLLNIQVRWINPEGVVVRTSDLPMDQSRQGALWTWQVDRLGEARPRAAGSLGRRAHDFRSPSRPVPSPRPVGGPIGRQPCATGALC